MYQFLMRVIRIYRGYWLPSVAMFLLLVCGQLFGMTRPVLIGRLIDGLYKPGVTGEIPLVWLAVLLAATFPVTQTFRMIRELVEIRWLDFDVKQVVEMGTLRRLMRFSPGQHAGENSGIKVSVISKGEHSLDALAFLLLYDVSPLVVETTAIIVAMLFMDWRLGSVVATGAVLYIAVTAWLNRPVIPKIGVLEKKHVRHGRLHGEIVRNVPLIQYHVQEERVLKEVTESNADRYGFAKQLWSGHIWRSSLKNIILFTGTIGTFLYLGVTGVQDHRLTPGLFAALLWWSLNALGRVEQFGPIQRKMMVMRAAIERYFEMMDLEPDVVEDSVPRVLDRVHGKVEFRNVTYVYRPRQTAKAADDEEPYARREPQESLTKVSFTVEPGELVAIVGPSGAGKSTVVRLMLRGMDVTGGAVLLDGVDIRRLALKQVRGSAGLVEQDVVLFDNTLRYNMGFGAEGDGEPVTDDELDRISRLCRVDEFYDRLEENFDTVIGERGIQLSGGQRQRVGIARAIMRDPSVLILDEATSNLDAENERRIAEALGEVSRGRTTIVIAHRFSTIRRATKVIVMDQGRVVDIGTHTDLSQRCEVYRRLLHHQITG